MKTQKILNSFDFQIFQDISSILKDLLYKKITPLKTHEFMPKVYLLLQLNITIALFIAYFSPCKLFMGKKSYLQELTYLETVACGV